MGEGVSAVSYTHLDVYKRQTLDYTQNLYEKKLVTYPRTDSRFLTEDMAHSLTDLVKLAFHTFPVAVSYTHLDVYKRQACAFRLFMCCTHAICCVSLSGAGLSFRYCSIRNLSLIHI